MCPNRNTVSPNVYFSVLLRPFQSLIFNYAGGLSAFMSVCNGFVDLGVVQDIVFSSDVGIFMVKKILRTRKTVSSVDFSGNAYLTNGMLLSYLKLGKKVKKVGLDSCFQISKLPEINDRRFEVSFRHCWRLIVELPRQERSFEQRLDIVLYGLYQCDDNKAMCHIAYMIQGEDARHHFQRLKEISQCIKRLPVLTFNILDYKETVPEYYFCLVEFPSPANIKLEIMYSFCIIC